MVLKKKHGRKQRVKENGSFSSCRTAIQSVYQGSVLGPLFFNIYINDLFISKGDTDVCNYSDDTTYYAHDESAVGVIRKLETAVYNRAIWFDNNCMTLNAEKCHLLAFGKSKERLF